MSYDDEISGKALRWIENGSETWQIFLGSLHGRMAEKGCMRCITQPRPQPLLVGAAAVLRQRQEDVKQWADWDERAYGIINAAMRDCSSAKLRLAQIVPDDIGCGRHAAVALATLAEKFDLVDMRTESNRRAAYESAKLGRNQSCTDFVSELKNLRARVLQLNPNAVDEPQSIIRLIDGLTGNKELVIQTLGQGITNALMLNPALTFDAACGLAVGFDNTPMGKDRLIGGGPNVLVVKCYNCRNFGHRAKDCKMPRRDLQKVSGLVAATTPEGPKVHCSHCLKEGHEEPNCFIAHPEKREQWQKDRNAKRHAYRAAREGGQKGGRGGNPKFPPGKGSKPVKPPSFNRSAALTVVGAAVQDLEERIVVDTGASEDIMILRSVEHFSVLEDRVSHVGTASEGSVLQILGTGTAGEFEGVLLAPVAAFNLASGSRVRSRGLLFVDSVPPVLVSETFKVVLTGKHVFGLPSFPLREFLDLPAGPEESPRS